MLVVDAGPLVAAASTRDRNHERCVALLSEAPGPLLVPSLVVTEVACFLADRIGQHAERAFARSLRDGELLIEPVEPIDVPRIDDLLDQYADLRLGIVDASVIASCERLGATTLATLDRRRFSIIRPRHCDALTLVP
jgi:predicted nucleic acid-binding protein